MTWRCGRQEILRRDVQDILPNLEANLPLGCSLRGGQWKDMEGGFGGNQEEMPPRISMALRGDDSPDAEAESELPPNDHEML